MPQLSEYAFEFRSGAVDPHTFVVARFSGEEGLSQLYRFDILLVSEKADPDIEAILRNPAVFTIRSKYGDLPYHGILASFEQLHKAGPWVFYRARLRPRLWWLTLTRHNQVFLNKKLDQFLGDVLEDGGLASGLDFRFKLQGAYPAWDYLCQYDESHFDFLSRWLERDGAYYWFEQEEQGERVVFTDTLMAHVPMPGRETFHYAPPTGMDAAVADEVVKTFSLRRSPMPKSLMLKDYDYEKPGLDLIGRAPVAAGGRGEIYIYGEHFRDLAEGNRLARVRAEEWRCREQIFSAMSNAPAIRPGYTFSLDRHYRADFNQRYLTTSVQHEGSQERFLLAGLGVRGLAEKDNLFYRNHFACIPAGVQFRPLRQTKRPRIPGSISAKVDAAGSGQYAELDDQGRYKIVLPFDRSGRSGGKASAYVRMMQPYAGQDMGMQAPLHKGTEVLLSFIDGDPDRPVIAGAVPNPETPSPVNDANQTMVMLKSAGGNVIHMEDQEGSKRILLHSPTAESFVRVGYRNDPDGGGGRETGGEQGIRAKTEGVLATQCQTEQRDVLGDVTEKIGGDITTVVDGIKKTFVKDVKESYTYGNKFSVSAGATEDLKAAAAVSAALSGALGLTLGVKGDASFGWKWTFHSQKEEFDVKEDKFTPFKTKCEGIVNALVADHNKLMGQVKTLAGATENLSGEVYTLNGTQQIINGALTKIAGEENAAVASSLETIANCTRMSTQDILACGTKLNTIAESTEVNGIKEIL